MELLIMKEILTNEAYDGYRAEMLDRYLDLKDLTCWEDERIADLVEMLGGYVKKNLHDHDNTIIGKAKFEDYCAHFYGYEVIPVDSNDPYIHYVPYEIRAKVADDFEEILGYKVRITHDPETLKDCFQGYYVLPENCIESYIVTKIE